MICLLMGKNSVICIKTQWSAYYWWG